jgi:tetratricopeptide (TPR) repeat protein
MSFNGKIKKSSLSLFVFSLLVPFSSFLILFANATPEHDFDECAANPDLFGCPGAGSGGGETEEEEREREEEEEQDFDECAGENANDPFCPGAGSGGGETEEEEREREEEEEQDFDDCAGENANDPFCPGAEEEEESSEEDSTSETSASTTADTTENAFEVTMTISGVGEDKGDVVALVTALNGDVSKVKFFEADGPDVVSDQEGNKIEYVASFPNVVVEPGGKFKACSLMLRGLELICTEGQKSSTNRPEFVEISLESSSTELPQQESTIQTEGVRLTDGFNINMQIKNATTTEDLVAIVSVNDGEASRLKFLDTEGAGISNEYPSIFFQTSFPPNSVSSFKKYDACVLPLRNLELVCTQNKIINSWVPEEVIISLAQGQEFGSIPDTEPSFSILTGYQQPKPQQQPSTPSPSPSPSPTPQEPLSSTTPTTAATAQTPTQTQTQDMITYENSTLGFRVQHPSNSSITERGDIVAFSLPEPSSYLLVRVSNLTTPDMSLENYSSITINALSESRSGFDIEQQENSTTLAGDGNPAFKIVYTDNQTNGDERKSLQTWSLIDDKSYDLTYVTDRTNFNATLPVAMQMIDSFQILGQNAVDSNVENRTGGQLNQQDIISSDVKTVYNKGVALAKSGQHEEAIKYYDKALALDPNYVNASYGKGAALASLGQHEEAIKYYDKALALDPNHVNALYGKGAALFNSGRYEEAILSFDKTLAIDPNYILALYYEGDSLANLGQLDVAIKYYDKVLAIDPNHIDALNKKGISLGNLEQHAEAMKYFDKVLDIEPNNIDGLYNMGVAHDSLGQHEVAIKYYDKVLAIDPNHPEALNNTRLALDEFE